ncbi:predicted protein [Thalassiosira pseudonana CCMP1335]|uniref:Phytanoyl-CoA dioxygenase n=1 Tax=Thalassiosira pseudonana TaxID=35128 RepID=B8LDD5_THAPS|nr:predicted protein [Thalassiosira pseudonana CCMP1335]EED86690.1 predicted protein [Thalassiosira pseudonana CCMP1335]
MSDVSDLLYREQENLIVQRGQFEETLVTNVTPLEAPVVKIRGTGSAGGFGGGSKGGNSGGTKAGGKAEGKARAKILKKEGVLRIDNVLSSSTADALRAHLYSLREQAELDVREGRVDKLARFENVLLKQNRCDLTIPMGDELITQALDEALRLSPIGATISSEFGEEAILHEFSCLMSDPGSQRQVIHPDTPFNGKDPVLYTCFIALQDVTLDMGPTVWLPGTHTREAHAAFKDTTPGADGTESAKDALIRTTPAVLGLLKKGSCAIYDSRLLHCGSANRSENDTSRALLYFSFKDPKVGYTGNPPSIRAQLGSAKCTPLSLLVRKHGFRTYEFLRDALDTRQKDSGTLLPRNSPPPPTLPPEQRQQINTINMGKQSKRSTKPSAANNAFGFDANHFAMADYSTYGHPPSKEDVEAFWTCFVDNETGWSGRNECCFGGDFEEGVEGQQFRLNGVRSSFVSKYRGYLGSSMDKSGKEPEDGYPQSINTPIAAPEGLQTLAQFRPIRYVLSRSIYSNKVGITVFVADYDSQIQADRGTWITKSFYLLDAILGEWDMIMHMDEIQFKSWDCDLFESSGRGKVLEFLADAFDEILVKKIN